MKFYTKIDKKLNKLQNKIRNLSNKFYQPMLFITSFAEMWVIITSAVTIGVIGYYFKLDLAIKLSILAFVCAGLTYVLKKIFKRPRPKSEYAQKYHDYSFPSGHSANAISIYFSYGTLFLYYHQDWLGALVSLICFMMPLLIGISRIYLRAHFISDVIFGWLLGFLVFAILIFL